MEPSFRLTDIRASLPLHLIDELPAAANLPREDQMVFLVPTGIDSA